MKAFFNFILTGFIRFATEPLEETQPDGSRKYSITRIMCAVSLLVALCLVIEGQLNNDPLSNDTLSILLLFAGGTKTISKIGEALGHRNGKS